jgi:hypothetical protein
MHASTSAVSSAMPAEATYFAIVARAGGNLLAMTPGHPRTKGGAIGLVYCASDGFRARLYETRAEAESAFEDLADYIRACSHPLRIAEVFSAGESVREVLA